MNDKLRDLLRKWTAKINSGDGCPLCGHDHVPYGVEEKDVDEFVAELAVVVEKFQFCPDCQGN